MTIIRYLTTIAKALLLALWLVLGALLGLAPSESFRHWERWAQRAPKRPTLKPLKPKKGPLPQTQPPFRQDLIAVLHQQGATKKAAVAAANESIALGHNSLDTAYVHAVQLLTRGQL